MKYLSSCSIVKNEDKFIDEFVAIHRALNIEHFLFFDRSENPLSEHFKGVSDITVIDFPEPNRHVDAWLEGTKFFQGKSRWVQYIDIDQVFFPTQVEDCRTFLQDYEKEDVLGLNWETFGSSGLEEEPSGSTYESYTRRARSDSSINEHIQTICNPDKVKLIRAADPHHLHYLNGQAQYNENKGQLPYNSPFNKPPSQDKAFIAHYLTRSRAHWKNKLGKTRADTGTEVGTMKHFDDHNTFMNEVEDTRIRDFYLKHCGK